MNLISPTTTHTHSELHRGIRRLLRTNPFAHLESSTDPNLGHYLVGHEVFATLLDETPSILFAPAGGGKTAARMYAARACWFSLGGAQVFPLPYLPRPGINHTPESHLRGIARAGAAALFVGLIHRPALFMQLSSEGRQAAGALLDRLLPAPLTRYVEMLRSSETPQAIIARLAPGYNLPSPPSFSELAEFLDAIDQAAQQRSEPWNNQDPFQQLLDLLFETLRFRAVLLQLDGVDASAETIADPYAMARVVEWPLRQAERWAQQRIFVRASLPAELEQIIVPRLPALAQFPIMRIVWTPDLLAEVVRRRVYFASGETFRSLDAISGPGLHDVETQLARIAAPLPREIILLASCLLEAYATRAGDALELLEPEDIDAARRRYAARRVMLSSGIPQ